MNVQTYFPPPPLSDFVDRFWFYQGYTQPHAKERLLPTGTIELVINLREDELRVYDRQDPQRFRRFPGAMICGAQTDYFVIDTAHQESILGVHFKRGGAFPFLKLPAHELRNEHVSLEVLWGITAGELRERLLEARTVRELFRVLEGYLKQQATLPLARHPAVTYALKAFRRLPHSQTIAELVGHMGLSQRRFIRVFDDQVGLTPKLYCRILRFQEVLARVQRRRRVEWADVALACGYYDQAHLIRDFRAFSGINPSTYLHQRTEHLNHVPLRE